MNGLVASGTELVREKLDLEVDGAALNIATISRKGDLVPIVFFHGFGSTKEAYDAPGCRETFRSDVYKRTIPFLVKTAEAVLQRKGAQKYHLIGHSVGGLTSLMPARQNHSNVLSFVNIEGNLTSEDCLLSRQIFTHARDDSESFFKEFIERTRRSPGFSSALYATSLQYKVLYGRFVDNCDLMTMFSPLPFPRMFMYGERNRWSYLGRLEENGVELAKIPLCGHFPMYLNPVEKWRRISGIL
ncbi:alpha/beta hydrolase fold protein [Zopfia rhizophila CBS 207.26]|uniref:Alpha/beta hydrolase fold protein n=1 Tax=Zopfia rhizophila CBS 207.26 TaxID=1314779 RepID=A0A6A6EAU2_9PEZI|nr:alpha/beta hydrolase fold protein [Zopfia rhizophila CBS 207.26]